jgi:hypothetical protein
MLHQFGSTGRETSAADEVAPRTYGCQHDTNRNAVQLPAAVAIYRKSCAISGVVNHVALE